ncbi:MAG TPA: ABC transporter ATP-binding protein [Stellaceae bacterium]|nr:ABC transporter ATP-binding protein [Stellaceae bacterium]
MSARGLALDGVSLRLGSFALRDLRLEIGTGEVLVLLGANGAGKSVCLETIAGFHRPDAGRILIGGRDVTAEPPERRRVGLLLQSFALFPHLSAAENVAVGFRGRNHREARRAAEALLARFGAEHLARRRPQLLSPGEKQRIALARALASRPELFLFDEPFSALDMETRDALRDELAEFLRRSQIPAIFVTHDHTDALVLADQVAIMERGGIVQSGRAAEVFARPAATGIARFLGVENLLDGRLEQAPDGRLRFAVGGAALEVAPLPASAARAGRPAIACIRAGEVRLGRHRAAPPDAGASHLEGRILSQRSLGPLCTVTLDCGFRLVACLMARDARELGLAPGAVVAAQIPSDAVHILPGEALG